MKREGEKNSKEIGVVFTANTIVEEDTVVVKFVSASSTDLTVIAVDMHLLATGITVDQQSSIFLSLNPPLP